MKYPLLFNCVLAFAIVGPSLFDSGILTLLDYAVVPHQPLDWSIPIGQAWLILLSTLFGAVFASKLFFLCILIFSGFLGLLLARSLQKKFDTFSPWLDIVGIVWFMTNPFAYEWMLTQPTIYLGIILLWWGIYFLFFQEKQTIKTHIPVWLSLWVAWSLFPHAAYMISFLYLFYVPFFVRKKNVLLYPLISVGLIFFLNINWLLAPVFWFTTSMAGIWGFDEANLLAFQIKSLLMSRDFLWCREMITYSALYT